MKIKVSILGSIRSYTNEDAFYIELDHLSTVNDAIQKVVEVKPDLQRVMKYLSVSVNNTLVARKHLISDNDEITLFSRPGGG